VLLIFNYSSDMIEKFNRYTEPYSIFQYTELNVKPKESEVEKEMETDMG
jgi:hypothetical protein